MDSVQIDPQLLEDCHRLGRLPACEVLLNRNAGVPWFILVPETRLHDFLDLPDAHREAVLADCVAICEFIKHVLGYGKVNFAGLGNVVPQMHLHVIGRHDMDPCWPRPVWGNLPKGETYTTAQLCEWRESLVKLAGLVPAER